MVIVSTSFGPVIHSTISTSTLVTSQSIPSIVTAVLSIEWNPLPVIKVFQVKDVHWRHPKINRPIDLHYWKPHAIFMFLKYLRIRSILKVLRAIKIDPCSTVGIRAIVQSIRDMITIKASKTL